MQNKHKQYRTGVNHTIQRDIPVEWDVLAAATPKCLVYKKADFKMDTWLEIEKTDETPVSVTWRLWSELLGEFGFLEVRKIRAGFSCIEFSGIWMLDDMFFRGGHKEMWNVKIERHREIVDNYFFMLAEENIYTKSEVPIKEQSTRKKRRSHPPNPLKRKKDAYQWVLAWEAVKDDIEADKTLKRKYDELNDILQLNGYKFKYSRNTWDDLIECGENNEILSKIDFEQKYNY
jgi:hypothetical protein